MRKLVILWKSDNIDDIEQMIIPYAHNSKKNGWWDEVTLLIWGASQKIVATNETVKLDIEAMIHDGIEIIACIGCSNNLGVTEELKEIGITVKGTGIDLTEYLQNDSVKVITM